MDDPRSRAGHPARASPAVFFRGPPLPDIYTLSLHDALPILILVVWFLLPRVARLMIHTTNIRRAVQQECRDRMSGSAGMPRPSSYAVFCLKEKSSSSG